MNKTKNTLKDLNDYLFMQLEALSDDDLTGEELEQQTKRAKAVCQVGTAITNNARIMLDAVKLRSNYEVGNKMVLRLLRGDEK